MATFQIGATNSATEDVSVRILNDDFVEADETFTLEITDVISMAMASEGSPSSATVTITDNDSELIHVE